MNTITRANSTGVSSFQSHGWATHDNKVMSCQYFYNETHLFRVVDGVESVMTITPEQYDSLCAMYYNDFIEPARMFSAD